MKRLLLLLLIVSSTNTFSFAQDSTEMKLPIYKAQDQALHDVVVSLDKKFFDAYNSCDTMVFVELIAEDLEFYHDLGGLSTSKPQMVQALKDNICNKVTRELIEGTIEVYPILGYGAVEMGWHQFHNSQEPNVIPKPSKFVTIWKQEGEEWLMARVISLH